MGAGDGTILGTTKIVDHGPAATRWNMVILSEGYQATEISQFHTDVLTFIKTLYATPPFHALWCRINIFRVDVTSTNSGAADPATCGDGTTGTGKTVKTFFDATFCGDGNTRRLLTVDRALAQSVASTQVPQVNMTMVIVNTPIYGGSGGAVATFSTNTSSAQIGLHEMGHTAFGFADEYGDIINHYSDGEPLSPNATIDTNRATIKWGALIQAATPMPTRNNPDCTTEDPGPSPVPTGTVGTFEGAERAHCGCFRAEFTCKMRILAAPFCAVCRQTIIQIISPYPGPIDNDLTGFAHGTPAASGSALDGYPQSDNSQHVNFMDAKGHIHELYRSPNPAAQWVDNDLTVFAGGAPAAPGSALDAYAQSDNSQQVNFMDAKGHIHELYRNPSPAAQWIDNDLTAFSHGAPAAPDSALDAYAQNDNSQHVNFMDAKGHIHELYRNPDPAAQWVDNDLTEFSHGTPAAAGSALDGYTQSDNSQHINFIDAHGHVHELYRNPAAAAQWIDNDLTGFAHGTPAASGIALDGYAQIDSSQHINFIDAVGHVHELYRNPAAQWVDNDLTGFAANGGTPAAAGSRLDGYAQGANQYVNFIDVQGHIHTLFRSPTAEWLDSDLTACSRGTPAATGSALDGYPQSDNSQHVNFIDINGHLHELYSPP